jgi:hypothetical protein
MRVVQTELSEAEHMLLEEYAKRRSKTIKEVVREAVRSAVESDLSPDDPIFSGSPSSKKTGKKDDGSVAHDKYLYGPEA